MSDEGAPKSSYELAMERLRKKDADAGIEQKPLTEAQRAAISEIRNVYEAKLAQIDVLHQGKLRAILEPEAREVIEQEYRRERERLSGERDAKISQARSQD